jgi:hypothetical protein
MAAPISTSEKNGYWQIVQGKKYSALQRAGGEGVK